MLALTPRVMALLGGTGRPVLRVRLQVLETESRQLAADLAGADGPVLAVAAAPQAAVKAESLPPPPGVAQSAARPLPAGPQPGPTGTTVCVKTFRCGCRSRCFRCRRDPAGCMSNWARSAGWNTPSCCAGAWRRSAPRR
jgi:hypothetical protein